MRQAYLTIDDSASDRMNDLVSFLVEKGVPALFYCRGDMLEQNPVAAVNAVKKGFVLANHTYSHQRASQHDVQFTIEEIEQCEFLINRIYKEAFIAKGHKYFRYPHVDRGTAGWVVDYDAYAAEEKSAVMSAFAEGLNTVMEKPDAAAIAKKETLQAWLKDHGYTQPFYKVTHSWFKNGEIADAYDSLFTYSNCDWMVSERHRGKWQYKSIEDLKLKARTDRWLSEEGSVNVVLAHDQAEIVDVTIELIDDMLESGLNFIEV